MKKAVAFRPSFGGITAEKTCNMHPLEAVDIPILMTGNGCMQRHGFESHVLRQNQGAYEAPFFVGITRVWDLWLKYYLPLSSLSIVSSRKSAICSGVRSFFSSQNEMVEMKPDAKKLIE